MADSGTRYEDEETTTGTMDDYRAYVASTRPTRQVEKVTPSEELTHAGGMDEYRSFVAAQTAILDDDDGLDDDAPSVAIDDDPNEEPNVGIAISMEEQHDIVKPRLGRRSIPIAKKTFTPEGMALVGATLDDDPVLLREVWCLNRGKVPLHPDTFKPIPKLRIAGLMTMSPAFTALLANPALRTHYAAPGVSPLVLWRDVSRLARTYWTQYALHAALRRDRQLWGFHEDADEETVVYECDILVDFLLLNFPKERKIFLWPAPPDQPASPRPIP